MRTTPPTLRFSLQKIAVIAQQKTADGTNTVNKCVSTLRGGLLQGHPGLRPPVRVGVVSCLLKILPTFSPPMSIQSVPLFFSSILPISLSIGKRQTKSVDGIKGRTNRLPWTRDSQLVEETHLEPGQKKKAKMIRAVSLKVALLCGTKEIVFKFVIHTRWF